MALGGGDAAGWMLWHCGCVVGMWHGVSLSVHTRCCEGCIYNFFIVKRLMSKMRKWQCHQSGGKPSHPWRNKRWRLLLVNDSVRTDD